MKRTIWLWLLLVMSGSPGMAAGLIMVHDWDIWRYPNPAPDYIPPHPIPRPRPNPPQRWLPPPQPIWAPLEVSFVHAKVKIKDQIAATSFDEEFYNPNSRLLEGTFLFPVPKGAHIDRFTMEINGRQVEAEPLILA